MRKQPKEKMIPMSVLENIKVEIADEMARAYMYRDYANGLGKASEIIDIHMRQNNER